MYGLTCDPVEPVGFQCLFSSCNSLKHLRTFLQWLQLLVMQCYCGFYKRTAMSQLHWKGCSVLAKRSLLGDVLCTLFMVATGRGCSYDDKATTV
jgi:hypothetical protein